MKTTKTQLTTAVDCFYWTLQDAQGGTLTEQIKGLEHNTAWMHTRADVVTILLQNPNKAALADSHLMERARNCQARINNYRQRIEEIQARMPSNLIQAQF